MKILLVEDDARIARNLSAALQEAGFAVDQEGNGNEAWFKGDVNEYDAAILDLGLPGLDGLSILRRWRQAGREFPILILTARGNWTERVEGIEAGADDYLPKPFQMEEVLARLRAITRRAAGAVDPVIRVGALAVDTRLKLVTVGGAPVELTPHEYRLVRYLAHNPGRAVSQSELLDHLYGGDADFTTNSIEVLVGRVRRKIGAGLIETRRGYGYVLDGATQ
ncbi:MAG: DNA-binding response regulator [Alphaproteobacteria bacterium 64-11]|nr:response regulator transcription factor [Alphaproteobacteria bacterium]OJU14251.1 MAG: DNA-binding response regulator [Alphaproteobacteria bacterium 64-11]